MLDTGIRVEGNGLSPEPLMKTQLIDKIRDKTAVIGILGLGYVGLPLALRYSEAGFRAHSL